jgi:hypothetical protein
VGSLTLRPGDSRAIPKMASSIGFIDFVMYHSLRDTSARFVGEESGRMDLEEEVSRWLFAGEDGKPLRS